MDWKWIVDIVFGVLAACMAWAFTTLWKRQDDQSRDMKALEQTVSHLHLSMAQDYVPKEELHRVELQGRSDLDKLETAMFTRFDRIDKAIDKLGEKIDGKADKRAG